MVQKGFGIKKKLITSRNLKANGIVERIHKTIGHIICTLCVHEMDLDKDDPWSGILGLVMFAVRTTVHTTNRTTPTQLVFGRNAILNVKQEANCINWQQTKLEE